MFLTVDPPKFEAPAKNDTDRVRERLDNFVVGLGDDLPMQTVGRILMAKAAQMILEDAGMMAAIWASQRIEDLLAGRFTPETVDLYIRSPNR